MDLSSSHRYQLLYNKYLKLLSPFGQKVMSTLIKLKLDDENKSLINNVVRSSRNKIVLEFNDSNVPVIPTMVKTGSIRNNTPINNHQSHLQCKSDNLSYVATSTTLLKTYDQGDTDFENETTRNMLKNGNNSIHAVSQNIQKTLDREVIHVEDGIQGSQKGISWNDFFDSEIFQDLDDSDENDKEPTKVQNLRSEEHILNENACIKNDNDKKKRKNLIIVPESTKKTKTSKSESIKPKNTFRKEKYTTVVKNWLHDVERANATDDTLSHVSNGDKPTERANNEMVKQKNKRTIQAQLANKDGIMKFRKPNLNDGPNNSEVVFMDSSSNIDETKTIASNVVREKKNPKFVAPIKSQIPVKDVTFPVYTIDNNNFDEYKQKLQMIYYSEVILILIYSNGFNQLNSHHTDDRCVPEGILLSSNDTFYYLHGKINGLREYLDNIMTRNKLICYDAKSLLIYSITQFGIPIRTYDIMDVKIGSSLISPDKPPESFSELQKFLEFIPEYTIATECVSQKASWYITLLRECSMKLKILLIEFGLWKVFIDIEMQILPIVTEMEYRGVFVNLEKLKLMEAILLNRMKEIESECYKAAGKSFQINSTVQVRTILYDELQLDSKSNVKIRETICKGAKSTSETMLRALTNIHPLPKLILEYRHLHKAHATFLNGIAQHVSNSVVRPTWDQTAAATGRIASNNPNLQAIPKTPFNLILFPKEDENVLGDVTNRETLNFRSIYIPRPGYVLLAADFKHIECRVFAHAAADSGLLEALNSPDLFRVLAAKWLNKTEYDVLSEDRERTKRIIYASLYGAGTRKLMEILDLGYDQVLSIMTSFNRTYPCIKSFGRSVVSQCEKNNYRLTTASGRARSFRNIASINFADKSHAERQAVNFLIQGTAADLCKVAMIVSSEQLTKADPPVDCHLLLQIHDELVWEVLEQDLERAAAIIKPAMENCGQSCGMSLTLPVAMYRGGSWGEMELFVI